jgi:hypothetical protein
MAPANPALPGHPSGCGGEGACAPACPPRSHIPATDVELQVLLEKAHMVEDAGIAGAPLEAYAVAVEAGYVVVELQEARRAARRWYRSDGTFEELPTAAEVVLRRVTAAQNADRLRAENERRSFEYSELRNHADTLDRRLVELEQAILDVTPGEQGPVLLRVQGFGRKVELLTREVESFRATQAACDARIAELKAEVALQRAKYEGAVNAIPVVVAKETERLRARIAELEAASGEEGAPEAPRCPANPAAFMVACSQAFRGGPVEGDAVCAEAPRCHGELKVKVPALFAGVGSPS